MRTTLVICLFIAAHLHAESIASSISTSTTAALDNSLSADATTSSDVTTSSEATTSSDTTASSDETTSSPLFDVDEELAKIAASCLSSRNYEELTGYIVRNWMARMLSITLITESLVTIGLTELRAILNFAPLPPWQSYTEPSKGDLASAPSIEAYYDLKEPRSETRSLDSGDLYEHNLAPAIAYFDKRFPSVRTIYRRHFEEIRRSDPGVLDKKAIDRMIVEFFAIHGRVRKAFEQMKERDYECREPVYRRRPH